jgi:hypothetical protein
MLWASKMQKETALSSTEAEYIALSQSMREVIPIMWLLEEVQRRGIQIRAKPCKVDCKVFEDNEGAIAIARVHQVSSFQRGSQERNSEHLSCKHKGPNGRHADKVIRQRNLWKSQIQDDGMVNQPHFTAMVEWRGVRVYTT